MRAKSIFFTIPGLPARSVGTASFRQNYFHNIHQLPITIIIIATTHQNYIELWIFEGKGWVGSSTKHQQGEREGVGGEGREGGEEEGGPHAGCLEAEVGGWDVSRLQNWNEKYILGWKLSVLGKWCVLQNWKDNYIFLCCRFPTNLGGSTHSLIYVSLLRRDGDEVRSTSWSECSLLGSYCALALLVLICNVYVVFNWP